MAVDPEELLLRPLRDVVALGTTAVANASTSHADPMLRAAQALVREGERALKKVQLVWNEQVEKHGDAFKQVMVQQCTSNRNQIVRVPIVHKLTRHS
jgi:hypothetical protein